MVWTSAPSCFRRFSFVPVRDNFGPNLSRSVDKSNRDRVIGNVPVRIRSRFLRLWASSILMPSPGQHQRLEKAGGDANHEKRCMERIRIQMFNADLAKMAPTRTPRRSIRIRKRGSAYV
jgi:hypothetical protein